MELISIEQEAISDHLLLLKQFQSPYSLNHEPSIKRFDFPNNNLLSLDEKPQLYMSVISHFQSIKKWIDKVPKEQLNEIFTIRSEESIEMIINKIEEKEREINFQFLIRGAQPQQNEHSLDLSKFRIAWTNNPIVYIDPSQALQCFETMIYDYLSHYQQFEQILKKKEKNASKPKPHDDLGLYNEDEYDYQENREPKVSLKNIIIHCLIKQIMEVYDTNKISSALKEANQIKEFSLKSLYSSEDYIRRVFEMTINQAIVENSFTKYKVVGRKIEDLFFQYMQERALALLDEEEKMKPAKKKKKKKKIETKAEGEEKVEEPVNVEPQTQKMDKLMKETNEEEVAVEKKKKKKKEKTKQIETADLKEQQRKKQQSNQEKNQNKIESILKNEPMTQIQKPDNQQKKKAKKSQAFTIEKASKCVLNVMNTELSSKMQEINSENKNSIQQKSKALEMVFYHFSQHYPSLKISMFGSLSTSTTLPTSDIDLVIFSYRKQQKQDFFDELTDSFFSKPWATSCIFIHSAKVPVIKLIVDPTIQHNNSSPYKLFPPNQQQDLSFLVKFDISFHSNNDIANSGIISTCYMSNIINNQPRIRELYILLKYIFVSAKLNQMYKGGFSSYCLFIMMIAMIQEKKIIVEQITLAQFLIAFLQFFAREFKPNKSILRFVKNYPSVINSQEYDIYFQTHNKVPSTLKFKLVDPITGNFITASFSKYEQMMDLFEKCMKNIEQLTHLALNKGENAILGKEKIISKFVESQLAKAEEMAAFCIIIP